MAMARYTRPARGSGIGAHSGPIEAWLRARASRTSGRRQSMWMCSWFCERPYWELIARLMSLSGRLWPRRAKSRARKAQAWAR